MRAKYRISYITDQMVWFSTSCSFVKGCGHRLYMVNSESSNERYQVWLGSETQLPSCQCMDYRKNKLPCKHICAIVSLPDVGWQSLGASFNNHPLFKLDEAVVAKPLMHSHPHSRPLIIPIMMMFLTITAMFMTTIMYLTMMMMILMMTTLFTIAREQIGSRCEQRQPTYQWV